MPTKILVVDDEPDLELLIRQKFRKRIRTNELAFIFAGDGVEALARLDADTDIALVLSDINMPRMDGLTLLGKISELPRPMRVVIVSAYGDMDNIRTAMNRGAFDFLTKPINFDDFEITVDKTIKELATFQEAYRYQQQLTALQRELEIASQIQLSFLPSTFPAFPDRPEFDLYATTIPAKEVGGDFYDFFLINERRLGFAVGDVSGKGIGAALFMAITRTMLRATAQRGIPAHECVRAINKALYPESMPRMFVTLFYGILDTRTGEVTYCNAGHNPPYLVRQGGEVSELARTGGLGLCMTSDFAYKAGHITLHPGDTLLLYSDGVTEAVNTRRDLFSEERLEGCLTGLNSEVPAETVRHILYTVKTFTDGTRQSDDITLLALQYHGAG